MVDVMKISLGILYHFPYNFCYCHALFLPFSYGFIYLCTPFSVTGFILF
jgi:hypothetical protein